MVTRPTIGQGDINTIAVTTEHGRRLNHRETNTKENPMTNTESTVATSPAHLMELFAERAALGNLDGVMDLYETDAVF